MLQAEPEGDGRAPSPPAQFAGFLGSVGAGKGEAPGPGRHWWPCGSRQAGIHPRCPSAKSAPAALAPRSQLFPPLVPDVSHYPNCNQPGSACFPDWGLAVFVGLLPPGRGREGEGGSGLAHRNCSSGSGANVSHRWDLAAAQLPQAKSRAGSQSAGQKGVLLLNSCCSWGCRAVGGHGGWVGGEFPADPHSHGCHTGWGSQGCSPKGAVVGTG